MRTENGITAMTTTNENTASGHHGIDDDGVDDGVAGDGGFGVRHSFGRRRRRARFVVGGMMASLAVSLIGACLHSPLTPPVVDVMHSLPIPFAFIDVAAFTGEGGLPLLHQDVIIGGGKITHVQTTGRPLPDGMHRVDGRGKTLLPGFVDAHTHPTLSASPPWELMSANRAHNLEAHLYAGVTTVVDVGGDIDAVIETRDLVAQGALPGPRVFVSGPHITTVDGYPASLIQRLIPWPISVVVGKLGATQIGSIQEAREIVQSRKNKGVDVIKIAVAETPWKTPVLSDDEIKAIVDEAHKANLKVVAHIDTRENALRAVGAGVDGLVHGVHTSVLTADDARVIKESGAVVVPTLIPFVRLDQVLERDVRFTTMEKVSEPAEMLAAFAAEKIAAYDVDDELDAWLRDSYALRAARAENVAVLNAAGVPILVGTDANGSPGVFAASIHEEMRLLVEAGVPAIDVLLGATSRGAAFYSGPDADYGVIRRGARADVVLVDGDPSVDISATTRIVMVMKDGRPIVRVGDAPHSR